MDTYIRQPETDRGPEARSSNLRKGAICCKTKDKQPGTCFRLLKSYIERFCLWDPQQVTLGEHDRCSWSLDIRSGGWPPDEYEDNDYQMDIRT